jgi:hypothetical protein
LTRQILQADQTHRLKASIANARLPIADEAINLEQARSKITIGADGAIGITTSRK